MSSTIGFNDKDRLIMMVWLRWVMLISGLSMAFVTTSYAGIQLWTLAPLTATTLDITRNDTAIIQYQLTNQSRRPHKLFMLSIPGIHQVTTAGNCPNPVSLAYQESCLLTLMVSPQHLTHTILGGPVVCQDGNLLQCYQPGESARLAITLPSLTLSPVSLPPVTDNTPYHQTLLASGGVAPYSYVITAGSLPPDLSLNSTLGVLSGPLATTATTDMTYVFTVTITDAQGNTLSKIYSLQAYHSSLSFLKPGPYNFTIPPGATSMTVRATGGGGGGSGVSHGGAGCTVTTTFSVTESQQYTVTVGGGGGGLVVNAGAAGGGSTNLFNSLTPILIAGGGGGGVSNESKGGDGCVNGNGTGGDGGGGRHGGSGGQGGDNGDSDSGKGGSGDGGQGGRSGRNMGGFGSGHGSGGNGMIYEPGGGGGYGGSSGGPSADGGGAGGSVISKTPNINSAYAPATNGGVGSNNGGDGSLIVTFE